ncbi:MAG: LysE family translocator [Lentimicrobiaceae bacterium]|jgi:threonine/homoserine/homoserine lactone efflux protein|nr:LysE family translocator [Lentimicrobiaceae bacterium]
MFGVFLDGILLGLTLAIFFGFGPAFFALIQTSIHRGFKSAAWLVLGIFLNDLFMVFICLMSSISIITEASNQMLFSLVAGIVLILFGIYTFTRKAKEIQTNDEVYDREIVVIKKKNTDPKWFTFIIKGFFMNIINPSLWLFWIGWVTLVSAQKAGNERSLIVFFIGTLLTILCTDLLKAFGAYSVKRFFTSKMMGIMNKIAGIGLMCFGIYMIVHAFFSIDF